ncbi:MAG: hypothetical protein JJU21_14165 [Salinarimonas sp.]|nr:hypothetical protein [Salinarimonas sp.]
MSTPVTVPPAMADLARPDLTPQDVLAMRRHYFANNAISLREGEELFAIAAMIGDEGCREWHQFFAEAITELLVHQVSPPGYLSEENARWFMDRIMEAGHVLLKTEFETLLRVMERARHVPDCLAAFGLKLVSDVVLSGDGTSVTGEQHAPGIVTKADVDALRRVLFVASSEGFGAVSRAEAEVLFDIADATADADNDPGFDDLFARAIGNHVLCGIGRHAPCPDEARRRETWLDETRPLGSGIGSILRGMFGSRTTQSIQSMQGPAFGDETVCSEEALWLKGRIRRNGKVCSAQREFLHFLSREARHIDPMLDRLIAEARAAEIAA